MHYLILNFKTYPEASGAKAVELAGIVDEVLQTFNASTPGQASVNITVCPQAVDIYRVREKFPQLSIWAQHVDAVEPGRNTGWTSPTSIVMAGASGSLVNHSEHKLANDLIAKTLDTCQQFQLASCLATSEIGLPASVGKHADFLAFEPDEFIGGDVSLIDHDIQAAQEFVTVNKESGSKLLLGAGVRDARDVSEALKLGYDGVLLASGFVKSPDPKEFLVSILNGFAN